MSVDANSAYVVYAGDGTSTTFPLTFPFAASSEVKATVDGVFTIVSVDGTNAVFTTAPAADTAVALYRDTTVVQASEYEDNETILGSAIETDFDSHVRVAQELRRDLNRAILVDFGETPPTYDEFLTEAGTLVGATALALVTAAGVAGVAAVSAATSTGVATVGTTVNEGLDTLDAAIAAGASALGLPLNGVIDVIPAAQGFDEGVAITDPNGWTLKVGGTEYYFKRTGTVGDVIRIKVPTGAYSGLGGTRIYEPAPPLAADYIIVPWVGQSDASGQDAVPTPARTATNFLAMLDTLKPTAWPTTFGATIAQGVDSEYIFSTVSHQGTTFPSASADALEGLITTRYGMTQAVHGQKVVFVQVGLSSADVPSFSYPTAHFQKFMDWCTAFKAACDAGGKTVKVGAICWAGWGAYAYQNGFSQATTQSRIDGYCGSTGDVAVRILPIFGQAGELIPVGICSDFHHFQGSDPTDPFVALAEQALVAAQPTRYFMVCGKGNFYLNGADRGWGGSTSHHHPNEEQLMGGIVADWLYSALVDSAPAWNNLLPTFARTSGTRITATLASFPGGAAIGFMPTGLTPTGARPSHGWFFCDPATPTVELTLSRVPYEGAVAGTVVFDFDATLPTNVQVRYGCRSSSDSIAGNTVVKFTSPIMVPVKGVSTPVYRTLPALKQAVP